MRVFANLFLILFLADAGFSVIDELVSLLTPLEPFTPLRILLGGTVVFMAALLYPCLAIDRRLPKRVFLPLILFAFFCPVSTWLFPSLTAIPALGLFAAAAQLLLAMLPLAYFRNSGTRSLTMPPELFVPPFFGLKNSLIFGAASLLIVPLTLAAFTLSAADAYMDGHTAGFMRLGPGGLRMTERVYTEGKRTIRLAAMIHIGNREYYDELAKSLDPGRTIVLAEGVSDNGKLMKNSIDYAKMAGSLGLTSQEKMLFNGRMITAKELETPRLVSHATDTRIPGGSVDIFRADVDASFFRPPTIVILNALGKHLQESSSFTKGIIALNEWGKNNVTEEMSDILMDDILHRRNMELLRHLDKALVGYDTIIIPWGALHMKELEAEILKKGFKLREERERVSIDFRKIFI